MGRFNISVLQRHKTHFNKGIVETGTYKGEGTAVMASHYPLVYTIELNNELYQRAQCRFRDKSHVHCLLGDSKQVFRSLLPTLPPNMVFFLDAHWSGDRTVNWSRGDFKSSVETSHTGRGTPSSREQVPLQEELQLLHDLYPHAALIYIDDMDKFDNRGQGRKNYRFKGEDWSHLSVQKLKRTLGKRLFNMYYPTENQCIIEMKI
jgi:hypothetical protein